MHIKFEKKYQKRQKCSHFVVNHACKNKWKAKQEKSFAGIEGTRLGCDIYFVKRAVLNGFNTVLGVEFIECDEACDW